MLPVQLFGVVDVETEDLTATYQPCVSGWALQLSGSPFTNPQASGWSPPSSTLASLFDCDCALWAHGRHEAWWEVSPSVRQDR